MGLTSFWAHITGPRVKEMTPPRAKFSFEDDPSASVVAPPPLAVRGRSGGAKAVADHVVQQPVQSLEDDTKLKQRSRSNGPSKQKSESDLKAKKRRSWWGGKVADEEAPAVPALPTLDRGTGTHDASAENMMRPGTALTTDEQIPWSRPASPLVTEKKQRRKSLFGGKRKRAQSSAAASQKRASLFGGNRAIEDLAPPMPAAPAAIHSPDNTSATRTAKLPELQQKQQQAATKQSRRQSLHQALTRPRSKSSTHIRRRSFFQSSNPDSSSSTRSSASIPVVPPLTIARPGSITPASSQSPDLPHNTHSMATVTRGTSIKQPRPISGLSLRHKSYTPRNAEAGVLKNTSARNSYYRKEDGEAGMICLSVEQQREWDNLKHLMDVLETRQGGRGEESEDEDEDEDEDGEGAEERMIREGRRKYANDDALAALEFGVAR